MVSLALWYHTHPSPKRFICICIDIFLYFNFADLIETYINFQPNVASVASAEEYNFWTSLIVLMIYANESFIHTSLCMYVGVFVCIHKHARTAIASGIYIPVKAERFLLLVKLL